MDFAESGGRLFLRYWLVILLAIAVPMTAVGAYVVRSPHTYTARTRLLAAPTVPQAQAQADAVVSQVQAVATSRDLVATALAGTGIDRTPDAVVKSITVAGVGSSGLVDLSYTDTSPLLAQRVDAAVAAAVVTRLLALRAGVPELVGNLDDLIAALGVKRAELAAIAHPNASSDALVASMDDLISGMSADRARLAAFGSAGASVAIVDAAAVPPPDSTGLVVKLAVALLLGLVFGLLIIGANETLRPRVAGAGRVALLLDAPILGRVGSDLAAMSDIGRRLRLGSARAGISSVVLVRADGTLVAPELTSRLRVVTFGPVPLPRRWSPVEPPADADPSDIDASVDAAATTVNGGAVHTDGWINTADPTATLTALKAGGSTEFRPRHMTSLHDLDASAESEPIGLVVIAGRTTRTRAIGDVRDLLGTTGWPVLGVLDDPQNRSGLR